MIVNTLKLLTEKPDKTSLKNDIFNGSFNPSTHRTVNRLRTADFHCVHSMHRYDFLMRTERKIVRTYAVRIVIYFADIINVVDLYYTYYIINMLLIWIIHIII